MDAADNQDRKEDAGAASGEPKPAGEHLSLKVKSQDGNEVYFKVKKTTTFAKVMAAYCKKVGTEMEQLDMEDEDEIDAMVQQTGGH